jgi:amino acid adenylation domain-containing protein
MPQTDTTMTTAQRLERRSGGANASIMLLDSATRTPEAIAILDGDAATSYHELATRACGMAAELAAAGIAPGDRVAIMLRRGADAAAAFFAVLAAGAVAVVVNEGLRPRQVRHITGHSGAGALIASADVLERLGEADLGLPVLDVAELDAADEPREPAPRIDQDVAQIIYTSGSTGLPKGVTLSHANLWAGMRAVTTYLGIASTDRLASLVPFSFDYGLNQLLCAAGTGATLVVERSPVPHRIVATLRDGEVSVLAAVPPLWLQLLGVETFRSRPLPELRVMTNTGGRLPTAAVRQLRSSQPHADLVLMYGLTEAFRSTYLEPADVDDKPTSIGRAIPGAEILVLREDLTECAPGETGQLVHRGPTVALGYWDDPESTAKVYRSNPLRPAGTPDAERVVFSGDLVHRDETGALFFVGRADKMIKTMGYRVGPDEVVEVLHTSGEVTEAIVTSEPDDAKGARIVAYVVLTAGGSVERLQAFCKREMPNYMQPSRIETRSALPRTSTGKHDANAASAAGLDDRA